MWKEFCAVALLPRGGGGFLGLAEDREVADAGADGKLAAALALGCDLHAAKIEVRGGLDEVVAESVLDADVVGDFRSDLVSFTICPFSATDLLVLT